MRQRCKRCGRLLGKKKHKCVYSYLVGKIFGYLTVLERDGVDKRRKALYKVQCVCGKIFTVLAYNIRSGKTRSCGCKYVELRGETHGQKLHKGISRSNNIFKRYVKSAKIKNLEFTLTRAEFDKLVKQNCYYCGAGLSNEAKDERCNGSFIYNGIDRVDNSIGYTIDNCVPCCATCNRMKRKQSLNEFKNKIISIYKNLSLEK